MAGSRLANLAFSISPALASLWLLISGICLAVGNKSEWAVGIGQVIWCGECTGRELVYPPPLITFMAILFFS
jgi:hypothetical protein